MEILDYREISQNIYYLLQTISLINYKPLGIGRSPDLYVKLLVQDSPNCPELFKYGILGIKILLLFP
jgi:hypothetical protein